ncbi:MAG: lysylphosphatidylglycerol synthase transmembrane domain-containing protein [Planctomycetota bacterium]|jgi:uncharacterized protein (TIRG00374 family)
MKRRPHKLLLGLIKALLAALLLAAVLWQVHWQDYAEDATGQSFAVEAVVGPRDTPTALVVRPHRTFAAGPAETRPIDAFTPVEGATGVDRYVRPGFRSSLLGIRIVPAVAGVICFLLSMLTIAMRWRLLSGVLDIDLSPRQAVRLTFLGMFFNTLVPGTVGGDLFKAYYAAKLTPHKAAAMVGVLIDRITGLTELALMAAVMLGVVALRELVPAEQLRWPAVCVAVVLGGLVTAMAVLLSGRLRRALRLKKFYGRLPIARHIATVGQAVRAFSRRPGRLVQAVGVSVIAHVFFVVAIALQGVSLSLDIPWYTYFLFIPLIYVIGAVPLTPGGVGLIEKLYVVFFAAVSPSRILVLALLARLLPIICGLPGLWVLLTGPKPPKAATMEAELKAAEDQLLADGSA